MLGALTAIIGLASLAALPYPLWLVADASWHSIDWVESIDQPINGPLLILAADAAAWAFWGWLLYATVADTVAALRGSGPTRMRLPIPLHQAVTAAAGLLGTVLQPSVAAAGTVAASTPALQTHDTANRSTTAVAGAAPASVPVATVPVSGTAAADPAIYVVRRGDALSRIARSQLGDAERWPEIYTLNRGTRFAGVGGTLTNPDVIYPGWRLKIPALAAAAPPPPTSTTVQPSAPSGTATTAVTTPPTPPPAPAGADAERSATGNTTSMHRLTELLPWLTLLGAPVIVALLRRRRRSRTGPAAKTRTVPAAAAPPATDDAPDVADAIAPSTHHAAAEPAIRTPPDRHDVARTLVGSVLDDDPTTNVIIPRATLRRLLPDQDEPAGSPALIVTGTVEEAIIATETETLRRARLVVEHDAEDYADIRDVEGLPRIVLVTHADRAQRARISAAAEHGRGYDIDAVILGDPARNTSRPVVAHPPAMTTVVTTTITTEDPVHEPAPDKVQVRVIGDVSILDRRGRPVPGLRGRAKEMLAFLAVRRDGAELPDIMEALWPDATVNRATERLSTEVGNLRRTVRRAAGDGSVQAVNNPGGRYVLNTDVLDVDIWQLDQALTGDDPDAPDRETHLRAAVALHTGELAGAATYPWIEAARELRRRQGITARQRLATVLAATRPAEAAELLDAAAGIDPYSDTLAYAAIEAYAALGATDAAQHRYEQLQAALADIGEYPEAATQTLIETVLGRDVPDAGQDEEAAA